VHQTVVIHRRRKNNTLGLYEYLYIDYSNTNVRTTADIEKLERYAQENL
jgi:hypothetical protein